MSLSGSVALVTGASRGVGRGVAVSLAEAGVIVYGTGRSISEASLPGSIVPVPCDHAAAQKHIGNALYGVAKAATDKLTSDMGFGADGLIAESRRHFDSAAYRRQIEQR